jgi:hypothetical protein
MRPCVTFSATLRYSYAKVEQRVMLRPDVWSAEPRWTVQKLYKNAAKLAVLADVAICIISNLLKLR